MAFVEVMVIFIKINQLYKKLFLITVVWLSDAADSFCFRATNSNTQKRPNRNPVGLFCVCIVMRIGESAERTVFVSTKDGRRH